MNRRVPYLSERFIERDAELLLGEFMLARHVRMEPPIPIEDIVEKHLKLGIEFDDLHGRFGIPRSEDSPGMSRCVLKFARQASLVDQARRPWLAVQGWGW